MPYKKQYSDLTVDEKKQLSLVRKVLEAGDSLHGPTLDHVNWTLSQVIHLLDQQENAVVYLELTRDQDGYGIAILNPRE